jgi:hypothetical protein
MKKHKATAIVDHQAEGSGRHDGGRLMLAAVRDYADICSPHIRP